MRQIMYVCFLSEKAIVLEIMKYYGFLLNIKVLQGTI